jgi:hypothetical protein
VTVGLSSSDTTEGRLGGVSAVTFTTGSWSAAQAVTVTGVSDDVVDDTVFFLVNVAASAFDSNYDGYLGDEIELSTTSGQCLLCYNFLTSISFATAVFLLCTDDVVGILSSPTSSLACTEAGGTAVLSLVLASAPTSEVTVGVSSSDTTEGDLGAVSAVTFTEESWSATQAVTVTGVDDQVADGSMSFWVLVAGAFSDDTNFAGVDGNDVKVITSNGHLCS